MDRSEAHAGEFGMVKTSGEGTGPRKGEMRKSVGDWMAIFRKSTGFGPLRHPKLVPNQLSSIRRYRLCEWRVNMIPHKPLNLITRDEAHSKPSSSDKTPLLPQTS